MFISKKLEVRKKGKDKKVFAKEDIRGGEILVKFEGRIVKEPHKYTLQIDEGKHLDASRHLDDFLNHNCEPNCYINFDDLSLRSLHRIKKCEEITFNYLTTEWELAEPFECKCNSKKCFKHIKGFKYLTVKQKKELKPFLSPFLKKKLKEEL